MSAHQTFPDQPGVARATVSVTDRRAMDASFEELERVRPGARRAYFIGAMVWCFFSLWPTTYVEWAGVPLLVAFVVQFVRTPRFFMPVLLQPLMIAAVLFWAWQAVSLLWTPDLKLGLKQVGCARWLWTIPALWPVMNRRRWLIGALACGFLAGNLSQALHALGARFDLPLLTWPRLPDRNSGWWDPVIGGTLLTAALGLHLAGATLGRGRWCAAGLVGCAVTLVGIAVTGTRGAWIAALALLAFGLAAGVWGARSRARALGVCALGVLVMGAAVWTGARDPISRRFEAGWNEVAAYFDNGTVTTDTGGRLAMARRALDAFRENPLGGVGAGGFRSWMLTPVSAANPTPAGHAHAHNALLHAAATSGLPGAVLALAVYFISLTNARRARHEGSFNAYDLGPLWAIAGIGLVSVFDTVQVNAQTSALMTTLIALSPHALPRARGWNARPSGAGA